MRSELCARGGDPGRSASPATHASRVRFVFAALLASLSVCLSAPGAAAATLTWDGGSGTWDTTTSNWNASSVAWPTAGSDVALFNGTSGTVTISGSVGANGLTFDVAGYTIAGGTLTLTPSTPTITANQGATISSIITGSSGLRKDGAGTLTLSSANSYTGGTTISSGTLVIASTASYAGTTTNNGALVWQRASGLDISTANGNAITGSGAIRIENSGWVVRYDSGGSLSSGTITIDGGGVTTPSLKLWNSNSGTVANSFVLNSMGSGATAGAINSDGSLAGFGARTTTLSGQVTLAGNSRIGMGGASQNRMEITGKVTGAGALYVYEWPNAPTSGVVDGLRLTNATNDYSGGTIIERGRLGITSLAAIGTGAVTVNDTNGQLLVMASGTMNNNLTLNGTGPTTTNSPGDGSLNFFRDSGALTLGGTVTLGSSSKIRSYSAGSTATFANPISGSGNLTFEAGGAVSTHTHTWVLGGSSASTYSGSTTVSTGNGTANAVLRLAGGTLPATTAVTLLSSSFSGSVQGAAVLDLNGNAQTLAGLQRSGSTGRGTFVLNTSSTNAALTVNNASDFTYAGVIGKLTAAVSSTTGMAAGNDTIALTKSGAGTFTLSGANTYSLGTIITAGTLRVGSATALGSSAGPLAVNGGALDLFGNSVTVGLLSGSSGGTITSSTTGTILLTASSAADSTFAGQISDGFGTVGFTKGGAGILTLSAANTFGGTLTVAEGTLSVATVNNASANGPLGNSASAVVLGSTGKAGTLSYTGATAATTKPFTAATGGTATFAVTDAAATLTLSGAIGGTGDASFSGPGSYVISGGVSAGNVFKTGTGALTLSVGNSQANTTVSEGQLNVNDKAALGTPAGTLTMAAGTRLDNTSGTSVLVTNPKSIALGSSLTFVGSNDLDLGTGNVTLSGNTEFAIAAKELTLSGDVLGAGYGITKTGAGTLRLDGLSGSNSFTGNSFVNAGTLLLEGSSILGGGTSTVVTVADGAFLQIGASAGLGNVTVVSRPAGIITASVVNANQTFDQSGTLTTSNGNFNGIQTIESGVTVTADHNYLGTVPATTTAGRIVFQDNAKLHVTTGFELSEKQGIALSSGTAIFESNADQALLIPSSVAGSGGIRKIGAGNIRLTGSNTYSGGTVIEEGIVGISYGASLGDVSGRLKLDGGAIVAAQVLSGGTISTVTIDTGRQVTLANGKTSGLDAQTGLTLRYDGVIAEENGGGAAAGVRIGSGSPREGTVIFGGANTYRGDTRIDFGTLKLASGGSFASSSRIIVGGSGSSGVVLDLTDKSTFEIGASQTLMGGGSVNLGASTVLTVAGTFSPGNSPGLFTYSSGTTLLDGTTLMEIWGTSRATSPSHGDGFYDAVNVTSGGVLDFNDSILTLSFDSLFNAGDTFNLFQASGGASLAGNFGSVNVTGSYYTGLTWTKTGSLWESTPATGGESLSFNAATGTLAVVIVVPEPGSLALAGIGLAVAGWSLRKRRKQAGGLTS